MGAIPTVATDDDVDALADAIGRAVGPMERCPRVVAEAALSG